MEWTDDAFLNAFENCSLPESDFAHSGHPRLAWLYLGRHPLEEAIERTSDGIRKYAASLGAHGKFHRTLTGSQRVNHARPAPG